MNIGFSINCQHQGRINLKYWVVIIIILTSMVIEMSFSIRPLPAKVYMKAPFIVSTLLLTTVVNIAFGNEIQTKSEVCGNPAVFCRLPAQSFMQTLFEPYDLAFELPKILNWQSTYHSENFYAIIPVSYTHLVKRRNPRVHLNVIRQRRS